MRGTITHDDRTVQLAFAGSNGARVTNYAFDGDRMTATVTVRSPHLKTPLEWSFTYRRE